MLVKLTCYMVDIAIKPVKKKLNHKYKYMYNDYTRYSVDILGPDHSV